MVFNMKFANLIKLLSFLIFCHCSHGSDDFDDFPSQEYSAARESFLMELRHLADKADWQGVYKKKRDKLAELSKGSKDGRDPFGYALLQEYLAFCDGVNEFVNGKNSITRDSLKNWAITLCSDECELIYRTFVEGESENNK